MAQSSEMSANPSQQEQEALLRRRLEESCLDIEAGRIVPMDPVLDRLRAMAETTRQKAAGSNRMK